MEELWNFFADVNKFCTIYFFANRNQENMSKNKTADKNGIVGDIGEHLVCYELSRLELRAVRTAAGAMGLDIIAYCPNTYRRATIQVKAGAGNTFPSAYFPCDERYENGEAERDNKFRKSPLPDFVVLVKLTASPSYEVEGVYVWRPKNKRDQRLLLAHKYAEGPRWVLSGSDARINGGKSKQDGETHQSQYKSPKVALEKIKRYLVSASNSKCED